MVFIPPKKIKEKEIEKKKYTCLCCGKEKSESGFFKSKWSPLWKNSNQTVLICKDCFELRFMELSQEYGSDRLALLLCCYVLDVPFYSSIYENTLLNNSEFNTGRYLRQLQLGQYQNKTFINTIIDSTLLNPEDTSREDKEIKWSKADKQNMNFAISVVGYDPFIDCGMSDTDRKYCFNILAGYCDSEGIQEDGHKIQSVIQITQSQLQCRKLDEFINQEFLNIKPDELKVKQLTTTKKQLLDSIAKIAQDNNLSSAYNSSSKQGFNTLSNKMKIILEDGYENIRVNLFDIATSEAIKQVSDISNRSILDQLSLDSSEYTDIITKQFEMITELQEKFNTIEEENRILKNKIIDLEQPKRKKVGV